MFGFFLLLERKSMSIIAVLSMSGFRVDSFWKPLGGFVSVVQKMVEAVVLGGTSKAAGVGSHLIGLLPQACGSCTVRGIGCSYYLA